MRRLILSISLLAFFVNPGFACSTGDEDFHFGEAEMRSSVEGTWQITSTGDGSAAWALTVQIRESGGKLDGGTALRAGASTRGFIRAAAACAERTLVRSAGACMDTSKMPLEVAYISGDSSYQSAPMSGMLSVYTTSFGQGFLWLSLGNVALTVTIKADGEVLSASASGNDGASVAVARIGP